MSLRNWYEDWLESYSRRIYRHGWLALVGVLLVTGVLAAQLPKREIDLSIDSNLPANDPARVDYDQLKRDFGTDAYAILLLEVETVFDLEVLARMRALHEELEENVPHLAEITSLVNVRHSRGEDGALIVEELGELWPTSEAEMPAFRELVMSSANYVGNLIAENEKYFGIVVEPERYTSLGAEGDALSGFDDAAFEEGATEGGPPPFLTSPEEQAFVAKIIEIAERHEAPGFKLHIAGTPVHLYKMLEDLGYDMTLFMLLCEGFILVMLFAVFRRLSGVFLPIITVSFSIVGTLGVMIGLGIAMTSNTQILPTFLVAVGIADSIHILAAFYRHYDAGESKEEAIVMAMRGSAVAVLMTSVTTAAGLASFATADLLPISQLGTFAAVGVMFALFYTLVLVPSLLAILPIKRRAPEERTRWGLFVDEHLDQILVNMGHFGLKYSKAVVGFCAALAIGSILIAVNLRLEHDPVTWYPKTNVLRIAIDTIDANLSGVMNLQIVVDTGEEMGLYSKELQDDLVAIEEFAEALAVGPVSGGRLLSIADVVRETHQSLNDDDPAYYRIPDTREAIAQEILLFESSGSDDLEDFSDSTFQTALLSLSIPMADTMIYKLFIDELSVGLRSILGPDVKVTVTGTMGLFSRCIGALLTSMIKSYGIALVIVGLLMLVLMGNLRAGFIAMVPNVFPILLTLGLMGILGIPLDMFNCLVGSIMIGIAVDNTIHFMHGFRQNVADGHSSHRAVEETLRSRGRALLTTSIVLCGGFSVFTISEYINITHFGMLLAFSVVNALLSDLILAPALIDLFWKNQESEEQIIPAALEAE